MNSNSSILQSVGKTFVDVVGSRRRLRDSRFTRLPEGRNLIRSAEPAQSVERVALYVRLSPKFFIHPVQSARLQHRLHVAFDTAWQHNLLRDYGHVKDD
jgi:hypothetical protein